MKNIKTDCPALYCKILELGVDMQKREDSVFFNLVKEFYNKSLEDEAMEEACLMAITQYFGNTVFKELFAACDLVMENLELALSELIPTAIKNMYFFIVSENDVTTTTFWEDNDNIFCNLYSIQVNNFERPSSKQMYVMSVVNINEPDRTVWFVGGDSRTDEYPRVTADINHATLMPLSVAKYAMQQWSNHPVLQVAIHKVNIQISYAE